MLSAHISVNQLQITCTWTHTIKDEECSSMCMLALAFTLALSHIRERHITVKNVCSVGLSAFHRYSCTHTAVRSLVLQRTLRVLYYRIGAVQSSPFPSSEDLRSSTKMQKRFAETVTLIPLPCALKQPTLSSKYTAGQKLLGLHFDAYTIFAWTKIPHHYKIGTTHQFKHCICCF